MAFSLRRARITGALTAMLALAALAGAAPAQAHDALASTSPADGQTVTSNPGKVSITLTSPPTTGIAGANVLTVTAPDGHVVSSGDVTIEGATLSTTADVDHPGKHTVAWRAVSADGHPIEGNFSFTYAAEVEAATPSAAASPASTTAAAAPEPSAQATDAAATPVSQTGSAVPTGWLVAAGVIIVGLVGALIYLIRRRNKAENGA